jgi:hypothetical protein
LTLNRPESGLQPSFLDRGVGPPGGGIVEQVEGRVPEAF